MEEFIEQARDKSRQMMDEAKLKSHLAAMEAEDYWEREGRDQAKQFAESSEELRRNAGDTLDDWQDRLAQWADKMRKK